MDQDATLQSAATFQTAFERANLRLVHNISLFNSPSDDGSDSEEVKDPAIVAQDLAAQIVWKLVILDVHDLTSSQSFLRKLKFRYLEQNAKGKYVTAIVSDIDDAAIVTAEDNKALAALCDEKKEKLRVAKAGLAEVRSNVRALAPMVEQGGQLPPPCIYSTHRVKTT
jgi:nucleotide-binding universal stress UspA family protein